MPDMKTAGYGKDAPWKSPLDFPTSLGNPAKAAGFPLSAQPLLLLLTKNMTTTDRVTFPFEATRCRALVDADGANVLVLDGFTSPSELLSLVAERLNRGQQRA
jgi:hypothetical protein